MGIYSWDLDGDLSLFPTIGDGRTIRPTPCQGATMDDESPSPVVPEEKEPPTTTVLDRMRARVLGSFDGKSDDEIIASLHLSKQDYRSAGELELQRRFVERLTNALQGGTRVAWALVGVTFILAIV